MSDSSTGGYLAPSSAAPPEDAVLTNLLQQAVVGITGLSGKLVRPRWQPTPPAEPAITVDWCAIGITKRLPDTYAYIRHNAAGNGSDEMQRHESLTALASFYGPNCQGFATRLSDGLQIPQNREALRAAGLALTASGGLTRAPEQKNEQWIDRCDLEIELRRQIDRAYPVLNLASFAGSLASEDQTLPLSA